MTLSRKKTTGVAETEFQTERTIEERAPTCNASGGTNLPLDNENVQVITRARLLKNLTVLGIAITLYQFGIIPCSELQPSIHLTEGLGATTMAIQLSCGIASQLFIPPFLISLIGLKNSMIFSLLMVCAYYFANFYSSWYTMVPGAIISGFGMVPIWAAKGTYLAGLSNLWSRKTNSSQDSSASLIFGCFYFFYYFGYVVGNMISYFILKPITSNENGTDDQLKKCGLYFADSDVNNSSKSNFQTLEENEILQLFGAFIGMSLLAAVIIWMFLDTMDNSRAMEVNPKHLLLSIFKALKNPNQIIMLPISIQRGVLKTFYAAEFSKTHKTRKTFAIINKKAYVACGLGYHYIGLTMMGFGLVCCICSMVFGRLVRWLGRLPIFSLAFLLHFAVLAILFLWPPPISTNFSLFFVVPCLLAVSNAVWESQVAGMYSILFLDEKEVSFSIYSMAEDVGNMISTAYSTQLPFNVQLAIFMFMVIISFASYLVTESKFMRGKINGYDFRIQ